MKANIQTMKDKLEQIQTMKNNIKTMEDKLGVFLEEISLFLQAKKNAIRLEYAYGECLSFLAWKDIKDFDFFWENERKYYKDVFSHYQIMQIGVEYMQDIPDLTESLFRISICFEDNGFLSIKARNVKFAITQLKTVIDTYFANFIQEKE